MTAAGERTDLELELRQALRARAAQLPDSAGTSHPHPREAAPAPTSSGARLAVAAVAAAVVLLALGVGTALRGLAAGPVSATPANLPHRSLVVLVGGSPDGPDVGQTVEVRDAWTGATVQRLPGSDWTAAAVTPDAVYLTRTTGTCTSTLYTLPRAVGGRLGASPRALTTLPGPVSGMAASPDGRWLASKVNSSCPGRLDLLSLADLSRRPVLGLPVWSRASGPTVWSLSFDPVTGRLGFLLSEQDPVAAGNGVESFWAVDPRTTRPARLFSADLRHPPVVDLGLVDRAVWSWRGTVVAQVEGAAHSWLHPAQEYRVIELGPAGTVLRTVVDEPDHGNVGLAADPRTGAVVAAAGGGVFWVDAGGRMHRLPAHPDDGALVPVGW